MLLTLSYKTLFFNDIVLEYPFSSFTNYLSPNFTNMETSKEENATPNNGVDGEVEFIVAFGNNGL